MFGAAGKLPQAVGGWDDDRSLYKRLKRVQQFGGLAILMLTAMVTMLTVAYYTKEGVIAPEEDGVLAGGAFHNGTSLIDLDLDPQNSHGVCMPKADQAYLVFIDGLLIAQGSDNCDMEFVDKQLHAPACHNGDENMAGREMWVAIEAQDSEALGQQMSKGAIMASMEWCGLEIQTNEHWRCSTTAEPHWMNPQAPLEGVANDPRSITHMEDEQGNDIWGEPAHVYTSTEVVPPSVKGLPKLQSGPEYRGGERPAKWIWAGGKSVAGMSNAVSADSVYCRRKISCKDEEFADQVEFTGYRCETAMVNQTQEQTEEIACEKEEAEGESAEVEAKCIPGLFRDSHNFFYGVGGAMLMIYMFVGFHIVCDDFFVPALNVLCEKLGIPDDIAGATFMAAGASSPELFASLIGVLSHSAVGAGTVVGSELFNMLVIIGGVCLVTPTVLTLDWRPLMREVFFFALSLAGILSTLHDSRVTLLEASILIGGYVAYVATCANYGKLTKIFCPISTAEDTAMSNAGADGKDGAPEEWELEEGMTEHDIRASINFTQDQLNGAAFGMSYGEVIMHSFMFKKSDFYTKVRNSKQMWQKRWLVLDEDKGLFYTKKNGKDRVLIAAPTTWAQSYVNKTSWTEFTITLPNGNSVSFKGGKPALCKKWVQILSRRIEHFKTMSPNSMTMDHSKLEAVMAEHDSNHEDEEVHDLLARPDTLGAQLFFYYSFPLLFIFSWTIPDVRKKKLTNLYPATMVIVIVWLAFMAEGMMTGAETAGCIMEIPEDVMGLTVGAAGTSLPNLFASLIVAKQGLGNMSVSNAFGSNTFNIFIALAVPWAVGAIQQGNLNDPCLGYAYLVPAGKIFTSCLILIAVLCLIVGCLLMFRMTLTREVGYFFNVLYLVILGYLMTG